MDIEKYKQLKFEKCKLPSGYIIKVKNLSPYTMYKIRSESTDKELKDLLYDKSVIDKLFAEYIVDPQIPDEITVDFFSAEDFNSIYAAIIKQVLVTNVKELETVVNEDKDFPT